MCQHGYYISNQIKSHCRGGPAASLLYLGDNLTKPKYQWVFSLIRLILKNLVLNKDPGRGACILDTWAKALTTLG